jgi:hypothetical protein
MGTKGSPAIGNNVLPIRIGFFSKVGIVSTMASGSCHLSLIRTKRLKIASDGPITLPRMSWIPWWRKCYGKKTGLMRKPCGVRLKGFCPEHVKGWEQIPETIKHPGTAVDIDLYLLFDLYLQENLSQSLHGPHLLDCPPLLNKSAMLRSGDHKSPLLWSAVRSPPDHPAIFRAQR